MPTSLPACTRAPGLTTPFGITASRLTSVLWSLAIVVLLTVAPGDGVAVEQDPSTARQLNFSTDEITWPALDISPDGKTLLFDVLGDIYTVAAEGGEAKPLLTGKAFETQPVLSPDGSRLAFISDRSGSENLWIANADGSGLRRLSHDDGLVTVYTSPAWSADGQYVYVSRMVHSLLAFELYMFHVDGGTGIRLTNARPTGAEPFATRHNALGVAVSPDSRHLYYATKTGTTWTDVNKPHWSIARRDLRTGAEEVIIAPSAGAMQPVLSNSGEYLVYATRYGPETGLRLRNLETGDDRWLLFPVDHDSREGGYYSGLFPRFEFTPGDRHIILSQGGKFQRFDLTGNTLSEIPVTVALELELGPDTRIDQAEETGPVKARIIQMPRQSPDGSRVVYSALGALYVSELEMGSVPRRLEGIPGPAYYPAWSPDGRSIVFVTWTANGGGHVWKADPFGHAAAEQITQRPAVYSEPLFTPDGAELLVLKSNHRDRLLDLEELQPDQATDIVRITLGSGEVKPVWHGRGIHGLHLNEAGQRIRFRQQEGVYSVGIDGHDRRALVQVVGEPASAYVENAIPVESVRVNPAGDWALARAASQLYLLAVPPANAKSAPVIDLRNPGVARQQLTRTGADDFAWADDGRTITWSLGSTYYRVPFDRVDFNDRDTVSGYTEQFEFSIEVDRDVPGGDVVLHGATVITMHGPEVVENADVLVSGNRIRNIGPAGSIELPDKAEVLDVSGKFIIPGLIDTHAHWFQIRRNLPDVGHWNFLAYLAYGVTAGLDVQTFTIDTFVYQDMIDAGLMIGPRAYSTGRGIFHDAAIHSEQDAADIMLRYRDHYRTRNLKSYMVGDRQQRQWVVEAARRLGMMLTTEGATDLRLNLTHAIDGFTGNEHALPLTPLRNDVIELFARSGIAYTPTLSVLYGGNPALGNYFISEQPENDSKLCRFMPYAIIDAKTRNTEFVRVSDRTANQFAADAYRIQQAGGLVGIGSHGEVPGLGYHWEMQAYAAGGAPAHAVLRAATQDAATIIGRGSELGSIEAGKLADLLILNADPLVDVRNTLQIDRVMKNGRVYDAATLDELWPEKKALGRSWFWDEGPGPGIPCGPAQ